MTEGFVVRQAGLQDLDTLVRQRHAMHSEIRSRTKEEMRVHDAAYRVWATRKIKEKKLFPFLVVNRRGRPVAGGTIWLREQHPRPGATAMEVPTLLSVYTEPRYRGRGLATMLLMHTAGWARKRGYRKIVLRASEMGRPIYARFGYKATEEMELDLRAGRPSEEQPRRSAR